MRKFLFTLCKSCMKKFYFRTNHLSVESGELRKGMYSWGLAGVLVFPWIKETPCVFATPNRNSSTFTLSAVEWQDALKDYWNTERKFECRTYIFSPFMMAFIYSSVLLTDFHGILQVRFVFITTFRAFSCRVVDSYESCLHETSLNVQPFRFLSR